MTPPLRMCESCNVLPSCCNDYRLEEFGFHENDIPLYKLRKTSHRTSFLMCVVGQFGKKAGYLTPKRRRSRDYTGFLAQFLRPLCLRG